MNRTLGFFLGSAVVFGMLVLILGQPVSLAPPVNRDNYRTDGAIFTAPIQIPKPVRSTQTPQHNTTLPSDDIAVPVGQASTSTSILPASSTPEQSASAALSEPVALPVAPPVASPVPPPIVVEQADENTLAESWLESRSASQTVARTEVSPTNKVISTEQQDNSTVVSAITDSSIVSAQPDVEWFRVWEPFHSELSANAFARRLERVTGLDYRVVKTEAAQYHVVMAYQSEEQRTVNLSLIEEATGLRIDGGKL